MDEATGTLKGEVISEVSERVNAQVFLVKIMLKGYADLADYPKMIGSQSSVSMRWLAIR